MHNYTGLLFAKIALTAGSLIITKTIWRSPCISTVLSIHFRLEICIKKSSKFILRVKWKHFNKITSDLMSKVVKLTETVPVYHITWTFFNILIKNVVTTCPSFVPPFLSLTNWSDADVSWIQFLNNIMFYFYVILLTLATCSYFEVGRLIRPF